MIKPKELYHGSGKKLEGNYLMPKKAKDFGGNKANSYRGVYATDVKEEAIVMGVISGKTNGGAGFGVTNGEVSGIIYGNWPKNKYFYLHILPSDDFRNQPKGSHQWVSFKRVKPLKTLRLRVDDFKGLVKIATKKEREEWYKKFEKEIKKVKK